MSDDDLIRRGDAARAVALCSAESDSPNAHFVCRQAVNAIRAIPAADARAEALTVPEVAELIEAYSDIIDYGPVVLARKDQWARLKAAQEKIAALIPEKQP